MCFNRFASDVNQLSPERKNLKGQIKRLDASQMSSVTMLLPTNFILYPDRLTPKLTFTHSYSAICRLYKEDMIHRIFCESLDSSLKS